MSKLLKKIGLITFIILAIGLYIEALSIRPVYRWKHPYITVKTIKITDKIYLLYYKNEKTGRERLAFSYRFEF